MTTAITGKKCQPILFSRFSENFSVVFLVSNQFVYVQARFPAKLHVQYPLCLSQSFYEIVHSFLVSGMEKYAALICNHFSPTQPLSPLCDTLEALKKRREALQRRLQAAVKIRS